MKILKDELGREWSVSLNFASLRRIRDIAGLNLLDTRNGAFSWMENPETIGLLIYAMAKPECEKLGIGEEDFARGMVGDALDRATEAVLDELVNFTPNPEGRRMMRDLVGKMKQLKSEAIARADKSILELTSGPAPSSLPGSSELTPAP